MSKFMYLYSGGAYPESPEEVEKVMADWGAWMTDLGALLVDGGAPFSQKAWLGGAKETGTNGYSIVEAESLDDAKELAANHPHLGVGGAIEVIAFGSM